LKKVNAIGRFKRTLRKKENTKKEQKEKKHPQEENWGEVNVSLSGGEEGEISRNLAKH